MKWYLYIVRCSDGSLYTGITPNIGLRIKHHNSGLGAKSLRGRLPVSLVYSELYNNQIEAAVREREIKGWNKAKKLQLVNGFTLRSTSNSQCKRSEKKLGLP